MDKPFEVSEKFIEFVASKKLEETNDISDQQKYILIERIRNKKTFIEIAKSLKKSPTAIQQSFRHIVTTFNYLIVTPSIFMRILDTPLKSKYNLHYNEITILKDLENYSTFDLLKIRGIGVFSIQEIKFYLHQFGLKLKDDPTKSNPIPKISDQDFKMEVLDTLKRIYIQIEELKKNLNA